MLSYVKFFSPRLRNQKINGACTLYTKTHQYLQLHHLKVFKMQLATLPFYAHCGDV